MKNNIICKVLLSLILSPYLVFAMDKLMVTQNQLTGNELPTQVEIKLDIDSENENLNSDDYFYMGISYSLLSPSTDVEALKKYNQESLGLALDFGFAKQVYEDWSVNLGLGIMQNSKTDQSLPNFIVVTPKTDLIYSFSSYFYISGGLFSYFFQSKEKNNFSSQVGQQYYLGYKVNQHLNLKLGVTYVKVIANIDENTPGSEKGILSLRGVETKILYLF